MLYLDRGSPPKQRRGAKGQSLVEFSLSMLFFFLFIMGLLDLGRIYFIYVALEDSAGEAAIFMSINPKCDKAVSAANCTNPNNGEYRAQNAAGQTLDWSKPGVNVLIDYPTVGKSTGNLVRVRIQYPFELYTPIISSIVGADTIVITAQAAQPILVD